MKWIVALALLAGLQVYLLCGRQSSEGDWALSFGGRSASETSPEGRLRAATDELFEAFRRGDYDSVVGLSYPGLIELLGGRRAALAELERANPPSHEGGTELRDAWIQEIRGPLEVGDELHALVLYEAHLRYPGGESREDSFLIAVSRDRGRTWTFVMRDQLPSERLESLFPEILHPR